MAVPTREDTLRKLAEGSFVLLEKTGINSSSWENFKIVVEKDSNAPVGYVQCQKEGCGALLLYKGSTTGMIRHKCRENRHSLVSTADKVTVRDKCVMMCASGLRHFNIVGGKGFVGLCQELINTGAKYGPVNAQDVLPSPSTVSRHVKNRADEIRGEIIPKVKSVIEKNQCSMACDLWTDNYRKIHYLTVTSTYIEDADERWELRNNRLITTKFAEVNTTEKDILEEMFERMAQLQITTQELEKVTFVTDQSPDIKIALANHKRLPCVIHCLNATLQHILNETFLGDELPHVHNSIQAACKTARYMKRSGLVKKLEKRLITDIENRWNGIYELLASFNAQKEQIEKLLKSANKHEMIRSYCSEVMEKVIEFLKPFKDATDDETQPTLPFVVPWVFKLLHSCEIKDEEETLTKLKDRAHKFLREEVLNNLHDIHYVATFLHPSFKMLLPLSEGKREEIKDTVRQMLNDIEPINEIEDRTPSPATKFQNWQSSSSKQKDELQRYLYMDCPPDEYENILAWWAKNASSLPKLSKLAREVLCILASSVASQKNFSSTIEEKSRKRLCIDPDCVSDILVVHNNQHCTKL